MENYKYCIKKYLFIFRHFFLVELLTILYDLMFRIKKKGQNIFIILRNGSKKQLISLFFLLSDQK